jgi:hypothetical protein
MEIKACQMDIRRSLVSDDNSLGAYQNTHRLHITMRPWRLEQAVRTLEHNGLRLEHAVRTLEHTGLRLEHAGRN